MPLDAAAGLTDLLPSLSETVYVGVSAGSIVVTPYDCDAELNLQNVPPGSDMALEGDRALGLVDFTVRVHLDRDGFADSTSAAVEEWAATVPVPTYALDDDSAVTVTGGTVDVVSEGSWRLFTP